MKIPAGIAAATLAVAALTGCSVINPITTQMAYDPSDGVSLEIGTVRALNLLVVVEEEGATGVLTGSLHNTGTEDVAVSASIDGDSIVTVDVPAGEIVKLGGDQGDNAVTGVVPVAPGLIATVAFQTPDVGQITGQVPVLDGTLPEYAHELSTLS